jgi:hypothetical protein
MAKTAIRQLSDRQQPIWLLKITTFYYEEIKKRNFRNLCISRILMVIIIQTIK